MSFGLSQSPYATQPALTRGGGFAAVAAADGTPAAAQSLDGGHCLLGFVGRRRSIIDGAAVVSRYPVISGSQR